MSNKFNEITLKNFNSVIAGEKAEPEFIVDFGVYIDESATWAMTDIINYLKNRKLSGEELNKTFHKSWEKIKNSSNLELKIHQIIHYISTYGSNFESDIYIPNETLEIPDVKLVVSVVSSLTKDELVAKCLDLLQSGLALKEETLNDIFFILEELSYEFTGKEKIKNKEAIILIADKYNIFSSKAEELLRYVIYKMTESTLLIKNRETINAIQESEKDVSKALESINEVKLAEIFNRFKVLFLAIKKAHKNNVSIINKISKLSKIHHIPLVENKLNKVTVEKLTGKDTHWLDNATFYSLFKALSSCYDRMNGQDSFVYRVRNGKSWVKESKVNLDVVKFNYDFILDYLKSKLDFSGKTILIPENVIYGLPTSEKMFVGNIPTGTKFVGEKMAVGIYWENSWGAIDLDLSSLNIGGKVGWNSEFHKDDLYFSGDITSAPNGAVEYLYAGKCVDFPPTLVLNNVFTGKNDCGYKIIIGQGDDITKKYMMNPNKVMAEVKCQSVQNQTVLGLFMNEGDHNSFVLLNFGSGNARISGNSAVSSIATKALYQQWKDPMSLNKLLVELNCEIVNENDINEEKNIDFDLSFDNINKRTFIDLFKVDK